MNIKSKGKLRGYKEGFRKGFSLIEIAIVLIIVSLLLGLGIGSCISGIETAKIDNTQDKLLTFKTFILRNFCKTGNLVKKNEIDSYYLKDAWNNDIELIYAPEVKDSNPCSLKTTSLSVVLPSGNKVKDVIAVILSLSANRVLDSNVSLNKVEVKNDDLWKYITLYEIKSQCCNNKGISILTNSLPPVVEGENYDVTLVATGGKPPYKCDVTSENSTVESFFKNHFVQGSEVLPYCRIVFSEDDSKNFISLLSSSEISINLEVKDSSNPPFSASRNYLVTVIRRKL
ncbi:type II secretion system protein [Desulfurobacterium thermolithotrophum]|uniref:type II secretion system protein n=1 Tax=Desulfurobacterium thermolithotrophum TaxID=64160 RepID=UPI0013D20FE6|nr:prepilin-type N-terminal cleavage/methylation domain-containing protein [Desulfurobacterium thermolithotrophum]